MISRRTAIGAAAMMLLATVDGRAAPQPALAERRAIAAYREGKFPALEKAIHDAAGFDVPVDVAWDELAVPGGAPKYADEEYFGKTIFEPVAAALKNITVDQMGRDALKAKLQKIHIGFDDATAPASNYADGVKFEAGVLSVNWRPYSNVADFKDRVQALQSLLEQNL